MKKISPTKTNARSDLSHLYERYKKIETVIREIECQIATVRNQNANYRIERLLLDATSELHFSGEVIIESKGDAIATAKEISSESNANCQRMVFFVDGSRVLKPKNNSQPSIDHGESEMVAHLGAAVVYKSFQSAQGWQERHFALPNKQCSTLAELFAIAHGLAVATEEVMVLRSQDSIVPRRMTTGHSVVIFSDSTRALEQVKKLREKEAVTNAQVISDPIIRKLITRSQYLRRIGVRLELCWVPGHSGVEGNLRADAAALKAAKAQDISVHIDEGLILIELEAISKTTNKQPPSPERQQKEKATKKKKKKCNSTNQ